MRVTAAEGRARDRARRLLVADGAAVAVLGGLAALFAGRVAGALAVVSGPVVLIVGIGLVGYGAVVALVAARVAVSRRFFGAVLLLNGIWVVGVGLLLGFRGDLIADAGRWLLTGSAVVAGVFAALEWRVPRHLLP